MSGEFRRVIDWIRIRKVNVEPERILRLYCELSGGLWKLQIRGPLSLSDGSDGKAFVVATASLNRDSLVALRDACNAMLEGT